MSFTVSNRFAEVLKRLLEEEIRLSTTVIVEGLAMDLSEIRLHQGRRDGYMRALALFEDAEDLINQQDGKRGS